MRIILWAVIVCLIAPPAMATCLVRQAFSPDESIQELYHKNLLVTEKTVDCSLYILTNRKLIADLNTLAKRGVKVRISLDRKLSGWYPTGWKSLKEAGAEFKLKRTLVPEHNKFCILDDKTVLTGSWNWSNSAEAQDNVGMVIWDCATVDAYLIAFERIWKRGI